MSKITVGITVGVAALCLPASLGAAQGEYRGEATHDFWGGFGVAGKIVLDAASAKEVVAPMRLRTDSKAAKGKSLEVLGPGPQRETTTGGHAILELDVKEKGEYSLYVRAHWPGPASLPNRACSADELRKVVFLTLDDGKCFRLGGRTTGRWYWVRARQKRFPLLKGKHTLKIAILGDGVRLDQILFTRDRDYVPVGIEK